MNRSLTTSVKARIARYFELMAAVDVSGLTVYPAEAFLLPAVQTLDAAPATAAVGPREFAHAA